MPFLLPILLFVLTMAIVAALLRSPAVKGAIGEHRVQRYLRAKLDPRDFRVLNDVTLRVSGGTTQIDHVVLSRYGIFVLETKHLSGWLFGKATDPAWTRTSRRGKTKIPNPLRQNAAHIRALEEVTGLPRDAFQPAVVLTGAAKFRTAKPEGVLSMIELVRWIRTKPQEALTRERLSQAVDAIQAARLEPGPAADRAHLASLGVRGVKALVGSKLRALAFAFLSTAAFQLVGLAAMIGCVFLMWVALQNAFDAVDSLTFPTQRPAETQAVGSSSQPTVATGAQAPAALSPSTSSADTRARAALPAQSLPSTLRCAYSEDTDRCICHDERGLRVEVPHEACKRRAAGRQ